MTPGTADFESEDFDIDNIAMTLTRYGFRSEISRDAIKDWGPTAINVMNELKAEMARKLAVHKDQLIIRDDVNADLSSSALSYVFSGSNASCDSGDTLTPEDLNEALTLIEEDNRAVAGDGDLVFFCHPRQIQALRDDSQFTNAAEYGSRDVIATGEIGSYLGIRIIPTTNVQSYTSSGTDFTTTGYEGLLMNAKYTYAVATNDPLLIEPDYDASQTLHEVNMSYTYAVANIDTNAAVLVVSAQS
jgi:N4-gp56 family major capsid protein